MLTRPEEPAAPSEAITVALYTSFMLCGNARGKDQKHSATAIENGIASLFRRLEVRSLMIYLTWGFLDDLWN